MTPMAEIFEIREIMDRVPQASFGLTKTMDFETVGPENYHRNSSIFDLEGLVCSKVEHACLSTYSEC